MPNPIDYRFDHIHVYCTDLAVSEKWFMDGFGAELVGRSNGSGTPMTTLSLGGTNILLRPAREGEELAIGLVPRFGTDHFGLAVDDLDATAAELKRRGVSFEVEPKDFGADLRISFVIGPDNVRIEIMQRK